METKLTPTEGTWMIDPLNEISIIDDKKQGLDDLICQTNGKRGHEKKSNTILIADAGTTWNKCHLLPSQLLQQRDELITVLKEYMDMVGTKGYNINQDDAAELHQRATELIQKHQI